MMYVKNGGNKSKTSQKQRGCKDEPFWKEQKYPIYLKLLSSETQLWDHNL